MKVAFRCIAETKGNESVYVLGSCAELGNWDVSKAVRLIRNSKNEEWNVELNIDFVDPVEFFYFIGIKLCEQKLVVKRWETGSKRVIKSTSDITGQVNNFGASDDLNTRDIFVGSLTNCNAIQVLIDSTLVTWWNNEYKSKNFAYKMVAAKPDGKTNCFTDVEVAILNDKECSFQSQDTLRAINQNEIVLFQLYACDGEDATIRINFVEPGQNASVASCAFVIPKSLSRERLPIIDRNGSPIGVVTLTCLVVKPFSEFKFDWRKDYSLFKSRMISGLHVGHKGAGNNRRHDTTQNVIENTIASLNYAVDHGADMVEFDVLMTKDNIPVLYHDFNVDVPLTKKCSKEFEHFSLKVKDLTYEQLQTLKWRPVIANGKTKFELSETDCEENQPFCSLEKVLQCVKHVAFNLEIKYPTFDDGDIDMNEYIDEILKTVWKYGGDRDIIISCFDPNVCSMVRLKQNKYFVLFLTHGNPSRPQGFSEQRMQTLDLATCFARSMHFAGVNCEAGRLIEDMSQIDFVLSRHLLLFCFGDDINNADVISKLRKAGVHGIIYDRIDKIMPK